MHTLIKQLNWRYATKQYDSSRKISNENLETLKEAIRLAPSSFGLQPYRVIIAETSELRKKLRERSANQPQITDASHLFIFAAQDSVETNHIDDYISLIAKVRGVDKKQLNGFGDYMKGVTTRLTAEQQSAWNTKQAYIGLGTLLTAAATLGIDATPMEGFEAAAYKEILGLTDHTPVVIAAVGYRSSEDLNQFSPKVRKPSELFFEEV